MLVTGGTGSLGTALCDRLRDCERVIVFSRGWQAQATLRESLGDPANFRWFIGDVRDPHRLRQALSGVDVVIHAAAMKEIVSAEYNPSEAHLTNVVGTQNVIDAAIDNNVGRVLVISTDKACGSVNCYGKTKALAESLAVASNVYARQSGTRISVARYGNVINSAGSVVPLFKRQAKTGKLTITDKRMTRFFLTMDQAVEFVTDSLERMLGGEIFVPRIPSASILDIAKAIAPSAELHETGIRPGEKLHEELITDHEARHAEVREGYFAILPEFSFWETTPSGGESLPEGWRYTSDTNTDKMSAEQFAKLLDSAD